MPHGLVEARDGSDLIPGRWPTPSYGGNGEASVPVAGGDATWLIGHPAHEAHR